MRKRQRAQQYGINNIEDCSVRSNSKDESDDRNQSEARLAQQHARCLAQVVPDCPHLLTPRIEHLTLPIQLNTGPGAIATALNLRQEQLGDRELHSPLQVIAC